MASTTVFKKVLPKLCKHKYAASQRVNDILYQGDYFRQMRCAFCGDYRVKINPEKYHPDMVKGAIKMNDFAIIYALKSPLNGQIFYVGSTRGSLKATLTRHCRGYGRPGNGCKMSIIRKILSKGKLPIIIQLKKVPLHDQFYAERTWIRKLFTKNSLTNIKI